MRALVTGGAGFLGSHLCERLLKEGHAVIAMDNLQTGSLKNIAHLRSKKFRFLRHDVTKPYNIAADWIFNFACPASPVHYQKDPLRTLRTSLWGAENACANALRHSARLLQASTSEVYGDPLVHPQTEAYWGHVNPIGPRACYDEGKRAAETLCFGYHRQCGMDLRVVRIFNTYGPRMAIDDGRVVSNFIIQALTKTPLTIYGKGNQTRSFCFVDDLIDGVIKMMYQKKEIGPVNLGNPKEFTIIELAEKVLRLTESSSKIIFKRLPVDDPRQRRPDITTANKALKNWAPKISLESGLQKTIAYFKSIVL